MTSVLLPFEKMHSDAKTKASNFALVERYHDLLNSLGDEQDGNDVTMETSDQEVPVASTFDYKIKTELEDETENVPDTPTILGHYSNYLPSDSILNPVYEMNNYPKTTNSIQNNNSNSISTYNVCNSNNSSIPIYRDCDMATAESKANLSRNPPNCFTFKSSTPSTTSTAPTPFANYSQSFSSSPKHLHQQQQYSASLPSLLTSSQSNSWILPSLSTSSLSSSSSFSSASSPSLQRRLVSQNAFSSSSSSSSSSPLLSSSSPMMVKSVSPAPSPYSSSPSSLSSSPLLSSSSLSAATPVCFSDTQRKTFVSEFNGGGCTVITGIPNFLNSSCYTESTSEMIMPTRNQEESLEYTDLDKLTDISFYDDLASMDSKDQLHAKPVKSSMTSSTEESCVPLEVMVDWMRVNIERDRKELSLPHNPQCWNALDASRWVRWVCHKHNVPDISEKLESHTGDVLCSWTQETFVSLYGVSGMNVFQELELWKTADIYNTTAHSDVTSGLPFMESHPMFPSPSTSPAPSHVSSSLDSQHLFNTSIDNSEDEVFYSENEIKMEMKTPTKNHFTMTCDLKNKFKGHQFKQRLGRGHKKAITLWQFLLELLVGEEDHSDCIKWLNEDSRIFKIEDSKKVASLWGKVKSRPAMNYDKLSRSVRQYYRKGIIKKPEQTKRLVYQFCPGIY